ncbi:MAG: helical backbone metal receptor [Calditrichales bacterium]|nr:helical backbone metal receptor [Calditrichales bacterium]
MKKYFKYSLLILAVIVSGYFLIGPPLPPKAAENSSGNYTYKRIVSLSPSTTETLFALGLGEKVVGVTNFCNYPPEVKGKTSVGGYFNPNYEAMAALEPDLVIILPEQENVKNFLTELELKHLTVNNKTIHDILSAIETVGKECGVEKRARELITTIKSRIKKIQEKTINLPRPAVLISIGRTMGSGSLKDVYIAGKNTYYDELINYAGGRNAYENEKIAYPMLSAEGIIHINPEIIIDMAAGLSSNGLTEAMVRKEWQSVSSVEAIKDNRLFVFSRDYILIPGPRFILLLEDIARTVHPEIVWDD